MDEDDSLQPENVSIDAPSSRPTTYELLMRQSRKMGAVATRTYDVTKEFLKSDVTRLHPDNIVFGKRAPKRSPHDDVKSIVEQSHEILAAAKTIIMPRNLFPDSIILDRHKLTIIKRSFFWSSEVITIHVEDILNVMSSVGPVFGSITISNRVMNSTDHYEIDGFWRKDVIYLKEMIQGYMIALHNDIGTNKMSREELSETLLELGRDGQYVA